MRFYFSDYDDIQKCEKKLHSEGYHYSDFYCEGNYLTLKTVTDYLIDLIEKFGGVEE